MRTIFFGTPEIAALVLEALLDVSEVVAAVCQPDRPAGRGLKLTPPPAKLCAARHGIEVVQPKKIRSPEFADWVARQQADVAVVIAYGRILPPAVLQAPRRGCMNLHASILPKYRGAAPINWAVVEGEAETGISLMQMDEGMDTGPVYSIRRTAIAPDETAGQLYERLAALASVVVREDLARAVSGELQAQAQDDALATMAPMLSKEAGRVDWSKTAQRVHDHVRGMTPWPGAHTTLGGKHFKLLETRVAVNVDPAGAAPGTLVAMDRERATIACGSGTLHLLRGQVEGKKALPVRDLAAGRTLTLGTLFGC